MDGPALAALPHYIGGNAMRAKLSMVVSTMLLLSACAGSREQQAASACDAAVKDKVAGRGYEMSVKELAASAKAEGTDGIRVSAPIVFDKGLTSEYKQVLDCRVRFEAGKSAPTVIFLQFNWATEDLKPQ